jgi:hypothetical protein
MRADAPSDFSPPLYFSPPSPRLHQQEVKLKEEKNMKNAIAVCFVVAVLAVASTASADSLGSLTVTGLVESSISLTVESAGGTTGNLGNANATSALGSINKFGSAPTGFSLVPGTSNWTLSSTVGIKVVKANSSSPSFVLTAELTDPPASGIVWKMNGSTLSDSAPTTLTPTGAYGSPVSYSWDIVVADSAAAAAIDNTINFTAAAN